MQHGEMLRIERRKDMKIKLSQSDWKRIGIKMGWLKTADYGTYGLGEEGDFGTPMSSGGPMSSESKPVKKPSQALKEAEMWCSSMSSSMEDQDDTGFSESIDPALAALEQAANDGEAGNPVFMRCLDKMADHVSYFKPHQREKYNALKSMTK